MLLKCSYVQMNPSGRSGYSDREPAVLRVGTAIGILHLSHLRIEKENGWT